jgi:8-oxo-dGTP diphosphatase
MPKPTRIVVAAGGLLESGEGDDLKIALINRSRRRDCSLPKGHVQAGETLEEGAIREVLEETGCTGEVIEVVQPISYLVRDRPKIVVYFRMKLVKQGELEPNDEVESVTWASPREAVAILSYWQDKKLVVGTYGL